MEVRTILKQDIKKKKGIFICIALLTTLIVSAFLTIFGVTNEYNKGRNKLIKELKTENICARIYDTFYDPNLKSQIEKVEGVKSVEEIKCLTSVNNNHRIRYASNLDKIRNDTDRNTYYLESYSSVKDHIKLFNNTLSGYTDLVPLEKGEIYLPLGLKDKLKCNIGDYYVDDFGCYYGTDKNGNKNYISDEYQFKIKGFVASPMVGAYAIGWKEIFISDSDFNELLELSNEGTKVIQENNLSTDADFSLVAYTYNIYSDGSMTDSKLYKKISLETKLGDLSNGSILLSQSNYYSGLYITIIGGILVAFCIILVGVVVIVISNSVSGEIESEYKKFGILKALGFSNFKMGLIISLLYLIAEAIGIVLGLIISIFLKIVLGKMFVSNTAILPYSYISITNLLLVTLIVVGSSLFFIFIKVLKIRKISPIKAINGNSNDIYFTPRINAPLTKKGLSLSLSIKQILFSPVRYLGIAFVMAFLAFALLTGMKTITLTSGKSSAKMLGFDVSNLSISCFSEVPLDYDEIETIKEACNSIAEIDYYYARVSKYVNLNGEQLHCTMTMTPEYTKAVYKGRAPKYQNEFITTKNVCDEYGLKIGDKVTLSSKTGEAEFILCGMYQNSSDTGMNITITYEGAKLIDSNVRVYYMSIDVKDEKKIDAVYNKLDEMKTNKFRVYNNKDTAYQELEQYADISLGICFIIIAFSTVFALVTIRLITVKSFIQERIDLGIFKANGFNTFKLRNSMALRFMIVSGIGIVLGSIMSIFLSNYLLGFLLGKLGIGRITVSSSIVHILIVMLGGMAISYISAYIASRRIKKVSIRELVVE